MTVLRGSEKAITTILQVLIDDPLLDWTLSADKLKNLQRDRLPVTQTSTQCSAIGKSTSITPHSGYPLLE